MQLVCLAINGFLFIVIQMVSSVLGMKFLQYIWGNCNSTGNLSYFTAVFIASFFKGKLLSKLYCSIFKKVSHLLFTLSASYTTFQFSVEMWFQIKYNYGCFWIILATFCCFDRLEGHIMWLFMPYCPLG